MVWHAYQLNPRSFFEDCLRYGKMKFWRSGFPWAAIDPCIDNKTFEFNPGPEATRSFEHSTGCPIDSCLGETDIDIKCPKCPKFHKVPWTEWNHQSAWLKDFDGSLRGESQARGLADRNFGFLSPCDTVISHESLRTQKFRNDIEALRINDVPMPGTLLNLKGT